MSYHRSTIVLLFALALGCGILTLNTHPVATHPTASGMPPEAALFRASDFTYLPRFARQLASHSDPISNLVWQTLSPTTVDQLTKYLLQPESEDHELRQTLATDLNRLLRDKNLYNAQLFSAVHLSGTTRRLLQQQSNPGMVIPLNRALLEDAYRGKIVVAPIGKVFEDEADTQDQSDQAQTGVDTTGARVAQRAGTRLSETSGWAVGTVLGGAIGTAVADWPGSDGAGAVGGFVGRVLGYALAHGWRHLARIAYGGPATALDGPIYDGRRERP